MDIGNVTQFTTFISSNGLAGLDPLFQKLIVCLNNFTHACSCFEAAEKVKIYNACNKMYYDSVHCVVPKYRVAFLKTTSERQISFYDGKTFIGSVSR